jgi:hypothetical protein
VRASLLIASFFLGAVVAGCGSAASTIPAADTAVRKTQAKGVPGGGAAGGTAPTLPPAMTIDGPSQFMYNEFTVVGSGITADINFDRLQNQVPGPSAQGTTRTAAELIYNNSKKTPLTITSATIAGANAGDFSVSAIPTAALPPNKDAAFQFIVTFKPSGEGLRAATLAVTSNAGTVTANLSGTGRADRPIVAKYAPLNFLPTSAPDNLQMADGGGQVLQISSVSITGANPDAFRITALQGAGIGTCQFVGAPAGAGPFLVGPSQFCYFAVGLAPGATAPASAFLTIVTNDPITPVENVPLTVSPL